MNGLERRYASDVLYPRLLAQEIRKYWFEPWKLRLGLNLWYCPDFIVLMADNTVEVHEVKGFWRDDARVKIVACATEYNLFRFVAVQLVKGRWTFEEIKCHTKV